MALVIAALAALFISLPFFIRSEKGATSGGSGIPASDLRIDKIRALDSKKESLLTALKDMEFDYGLGKLSKEDFEDLSRQYKVEAAEILKQMDSIGKQAPQAVIEDDLEREIKAERKKGLAVYEDEDIEKEILRAREAVWHDESGTLNCPKCGNGYDREDIFCSKCGAKLNGDSENKHATSL